VGVETNYSTHLSWNIGMLYNHFFPSINNLILWLVLTSDQSHEQVKKTCLIHNESSNFSLTILQQNLKRSVFNIHKDINTVWLSFYSNSFTFYTMHISPWSDIRDFEISFPSIHLALGKLHPIREEWWIRICEFNFTFKMSYLNLEFTRKTGTFKGLHNYHHIKKKNRDKLWTSEISVNIFFIDSEKTIITAWGMSSNEFKQKRGGNSFYDTTFWVSKPFWVVMKKYKRTSCRNHNLCKIRIK